MYIFLWSTCAQHVLNFCSHVLQYLINVVVFSLLVNSGGSAQPATQSGQTPQNAHTQATVSTGGDYQALHQIVPRSGQTLQNAQTQAACSNGGDYQASHQVLQRSGQTLQNAQTQSACSTGGDYQESHQVLQRSGQTPQNGFNHAASSIGGEQLQVLQRSGQSGLLHNTPFPTIGPGLSLTNSLHNPGIIPV